MTRSTRVVLRRAPPRLAKERPSEAPRRAPGHTRVTRSSSAYRRSTSSSSSEALIMSDDNGDEEEEDDDGDDDDDDDDEDELVKDEVAPPTSNGPHIESRQLRKRGRPPIPFTPKTQLQANPPTKRPRRGKTPNATECNRRGRPANLTNSHKKSASVSAQKKFEPSSRHHGQTSNDDNQLEPGPRLPWSELPYLLLVEVFAFAAAPLNDYASVSWLLAASRICRAFAEPALTALYRNPPLLDVAMAHGLVQHLEKPLLETRFNYRQKVERLEIDVGLVAHPTYNRQHLDLESLVKNCPRLASLELFHQKDNPPYRDLDDRLRWQYPAGLFQGLAASGTHLRSWRWNSRLAGPDFSFDAIKMIHESPSFSRLRKVAFVNYQMPSLLAKNVDEVEINAMDKKEAEIIATLFQDCLSELKHLVFESCTIVNEHLMPLLPPTLEHLELVNCWDVTADSLAEFLGSHGHHIRHLSLHHNQSLSLAFLPLLGECCPKLETLQMNLTYYKHHSSYDDSQPAYDELLLADQVPKWPRNIRVVAIENMRKWSPEAAEVFFQSFIDCAAEMPDLRVLSFKVMLNIPWRQRSAMREAWELRLKRCFERKPKNPMLWRSIKDVPLQRDADAKARMKEKEKRGLADKSGAVDEPSRRSGRISELSERSSRSSSAARGLRPKGRETISYAEPDTDDDDLEDEDLDDEESSRETAEEQSRPPSSHDESYFVHGLCDVVDIRFDNQKPTEMQFGMDDFLDQGDDAVSDDDWDGDDDAEDDRYAW
ncbi:hypothetical protein MCOR27_004885 [Pyricularia oryzae]|uniref:Uncharacterized protein n=1 Tax=Pyricularia oryzae TaxID=318829 RepID=A0A4P7NGN8_PYROR|nr:hypothetical protein MCOR27_004885 [Pyricularia oryzae]KAI6285309.1 hypothetical protein MCOR26_001547 [Pyricularia oryzae]KAI6328309.1 hypothetical protein MCOR29_002733 [Pyricularia oryzae]KAI6339870.1 hypothetical protein MCOR30_002626 [Pyricularia oryzae]KAI6345037.1 hypothetical protein MCOR28_003794 [Pyricularia oryzae]